MRIIPQRPEDKPPCPQSGINGAPQHPAHAVEIAVANRVYAVVPRDGEGEELPEFEQVSMAASLQPGMELYQSIATPLSPHGRSYYSATFFQCLVCGFVLPAQEIQR